MTDSGSTTTPHRRKLRGIDPGRDSKLVKDMQQKQKGKIKNPET
jgi:hypothetical protein